jgi:hypothetical protein
MVGFHSYRSARHWKGKGMASKRKAAAREREGEAFQEPKAGHYWNGMEWLPIADALTGPEAAIPSPDMTRRERKALGKAYRAQEEIKLVRELDREGDKGAQALQVKRGRPAMEYDPALGEEICQRLSNGQSLTAICELPHMPSVPTVYGWIRKEASFASDYMRAREEQAHSLFDSCLVIADDVSADLIPDDEGKLTANTTAVTRAKLRIDTRMRMAAKLSPKVFSERSETLGIANGGTVNVQVNAMTIDARTLDTDQRDSLRKLLLEARSNIIDV